MLKRIFILAGLVLISSMLHAQAGATASRVGDLKIGGGFSTANSDYGDRYNGGGAYLNFDFLPHVGIEGEFHFVKDRDDLYEKTYLVGGRYYRNYRRWSPYLKGLFGRGVFNYPALPDGFQANLGYNVMGMGIGTDYKLKKSIVLRADWEYQHWFGFQDSSLTPSIFSIGGAYRFPARKE